MAEVYDKPPVANVKQITPGRFSSRHGDGNRRATSGVVTVRQGKDDGSATQGVAIGSRADSLAVGADRRHGGSFPPGTARGALRSVHPRRLACAACPSGIGLRVLRLHLQPAKLRSSLIRPPIAAAAVFPARPCATL